MDASNMHARHASCESLVAGQKGRSRQTKVRQGSESGARVPMEGLFPAEESKTENGAGQRNSAEDEPRQSGVEAQPGVLHH